jgi:cobalt ECF transporter T component CbiQ
VLDRALERIGSVIGTTFMQWEFASKKGLLQAMDARVKLVCLLFLLVIGTIKHDIAPGLALTGLLFLLVCLSRLNPVHFYRRVGALAFLFGFLIVLPAACNLVTDGKIILSLMRFRSARTFWVYTLPETIGITREGLSVVGLVTLRMVNCLTISFLLLHTTPFPHIIKSFKIFRVPDALLILFVLTYKYIFIFSKMLEAIHLARKSRLSGRHQAGGAAWAAGRIAFLFRKTQGRCEEIFQAMVSRGLSKEIELAGAGKLRRIDVAEGLCLFCCGVILLWI